MNKKYKSLVPVKGGLGNQMFFYAFSIYLRSKGLNPFLVWHEFVFTKQHNGVELLNAFDVAIDDSEKRKISFFLWINKLSLPFIFKRILGRILRCKYSWVDEYKQVSPYSFDSIDDLKNKSVYLDGFWQNYQYLTPIREELLKVFKFRLPDQFEENIYLEKIVSSTSVSIHIRRGDYLDSQFSNLNVIRSTKYYFEAIEFMKQKYGNPKFFIFTDDVIWAKNNFIGDEFEFVEGNLNQSSYLDIYLMSICKHNIIANSTFSWWGAWLNKNPSKTVIAPEMWTCDTFSYELCPSHWVFLGV